MNKISFDEKPIEDITQSDIVVAIDAAGNLVPGHVSKLFTNTTSEFTRLTFADGRDDLVTTPGHRFQTETGDYMEIGHMLRLGGGSVRVVDVDGSIVEASGEMLAYSAETDHLFAQSATKTIAYEGNTVFKEQVEAGWQTYNFEVREHHNYVAGGIRVHNDSILATLEEGDQLVALNDDLTDAAVLRDANSDGTADFVTLDGYRRDGEATDLALERVYYWNPASGELATLLANQVALAPSSTGEVFDPSAGNSWNDGQFGDDIEEVFFDDVVGRPESGTDRAVVDALYSETFFMGENVTDLASSQDIVASQSLINAIDFAATSEADALELAAFLIDVDVNSSAFFGFAATFGNTFENAGDSSGSSFVRGTSVGEELIGTNEADVIQGLGGNDELRGQDGNDMIYGGDGDDILRGAAGNDILDGGAGNDFIRGGGNYDTIYGGSGDDRVLGDNGVDYVELGTGNDIFEDNDQNDSNGHDEVHGGDGRDNIIGGGGDDIFYGDDGNDRISGGIGDDTIYGGLNNDIINAGDGNDMVWGDNGRDRVNLGNGNDIFNDSNQGGNSGRDVVKGGTGNDVFNGGGGNDTLTGGTGADRFIFNTGNDDDTITDFDADEDTLVINGAEINFASLPGGVSTQESGSDVIVSYGSGDTITLSDNSLTDL